MGVNGRVSGGHQDKRLKRVVLLFICLATCRWATVDGAREWGLNSMLVSLLHPDRTQATAANQQTQRTGLAHPCDELWLLNPALMLLPLAPMAQQQWTQPSIQPCTHLRMHVDVVDIDDVVQHPGRHVLVLPARQCMRAGRKPQVTGRAVGSMHADQTLAHRTAAVTLLPWLAGSPALDALPRQKLALKDVREGAVPQVMAQPRQLHLQHINGAEQGAAGRLQLAERQGAVLAVRKQTVEPQH